MFNNDRLRRQFWTGLDDEHLASIGFANFAWNALERKLASLIWVVAGWTQEVGELVTADLGNVSATTLLVNFVKRELHENPDDSLLDQTSRTSAVFDGIRSDRNDMVHSFFCHDPTKGIGRHMKISAKGRNGQAEIKTIAMSKEELDLHCDAISTCFDSIDDLVHKFHFRRRYLTGERYATASTYEKAVHGWRAPPFDSELLRAYLKRRSKRIKPDVHI